MTEINGFRICHIVTGLDQGGVESWLYRLIQHSSKTSEHHVISMQNKGVYGDKLIEAGANVYELNMGNGFISNIIAIKKIWLLLKAINPNAIQCWMYHANFFGGVISYICGYRNIYWGIFATSLEVCITSKLTLLTDRLSSILSHFIPKLIIVCSSEAIAPHVKLGYKKSFKSIPLGYSAKEFKFNEKSREYYRKKWNISNTEILIGCIARWDPYKDHPNLILALKEVLSRVSPSAGVKLVLIGPNMDTKNLELMRIIKKNIHNSDHVILAGRVDNIADAISALDFHVLSSVSELFPNVIAETMLCGVPNIVTNVGGCKAIVGQYGWSVPAGSSNLLANSIYEAICKFELKKEWAEMKDGSRQHIIKNYEIKDVCNKYYEIWK